LRKQHHVHKITSDGFHSNEMQVTLHEEQTSKPNSSSPFHEIRTKIVTFTWQ